MGTILLKNIMLDGKAVDIRMTGNRISSIVPPADRCKSGLPEAASGVEVVDCTGKTAFPGFVNMHTHAAMALMRGIGEDVDFREWIARIWEVEAGLDEEYVYWGTKAACLEMLKTGTTTFNDQYWFSPTGHKAAVEMGMRPVVSYVVLDHYNKEEAERQKEQCVRMYEQSLQWPEQSQFSMAFHSVYSVSREMMLWSSEFARQHGLKLHIHLSETENEVKECIAKHGMSPVKYLDSLGILGPDVIAAHTLWLSDEDIEILGRNRVSCVHNINSNLKLASGYRFRYNELRDAGANVCLGTDGCASSNNLDMLEAMKTAAIVQKAWREDPLAMPLDELVAMATVNGAQALGLNVGRIETGALADILIIDTDNTFFLSPGPFLANLVYSAHSDCIDSVICNGKFVMKGRKVKGEQEILKNAASVMSRLHI